MEAPARVPIEPEIRAHVREMFGGHCAYCGIQLRKSFHVDHVIPVASGGVNDICNYFPSCATCNHFKNAASLEQFRTILYNQTTQKASFILAERFGQITAHPKKIEFWFERCGHKFDEELVLALIKGQDVSN